MTFYDQLWGRPFLQQSRGSGQAGLFFPELRPLKAVKGVARAQHASWGQLTRCRQSQQYPLYSSTKAPLGSVSYQKHCDQDGQIGHGTSLRAGHGSAHRQGTLPMFFFSMVVVTCSWRAQPWFPPGRKQWPLLPLQPFQTWLLMWLPRRRSPGNTQACKSWPAGCAWVSAVIGPDQHEFMKGKSCLTSLIPISDQVMHLDGWSLSSRGVVCLVRWLVLA